MGAGKSLCEESGRLSGKSGGLRRAGEQRGEVCRKVRAVSQ